MLNEIITVYAIINDLLKAIGHNEDRRRNMNDAEIITTSVCAAMFFDGNHSKACLTFHGMWKGKIGSRVAYANHYDFLCLEVSSTKSFKP